MSEIAALEKMIKDKLGYLNEVFNNHAIAAIAEPTYLKLIDTKLGSCVGAAERIYADANLVVLDSADPEKPKVTEKGDEVGDGPDEPDIDH